MGREIDWERLKVEYLTGDMSLRRLADSHGMSRSTVLSYARRHLWKKTKTEMHTAVDTAIDQKLVDIRADAAISRVERLDGMIDALLEKTEQAIRDMDKRIINGETVRVPISAKDVRSLTSALKDLAELIGYIGREEDDGQQTGVIILPEIMIPESR